ncbi:hypothetical protein BU23DRAFT_500572 [Bimuria novae-zelandiae CBS 107.79]|uniref:BZIP domain-containing protein n=1 Tax=Bimuria novae-zelandiae CBS 107.79 TaxID=1447943 RepID=A0A6A5VRY0_9PLEO|nr:hypothetical protein BU23DRAFT_500572 [Bimuria novae-zelandiae CBS 107.79]
MDDATHQPKKKPPYKRRMTEKRRNQNRAAQKAYRERRKERLEQLEHQVTAWQQQDESTSAYKDTSEFSSGRIIEDLSGLDLDAYDEIPPLPKPDSSFADLKNLFKDDDSPDLDELVNFALQEKPDMSKILIAGLRVLKLEKETTLTLEKKRRSVSWATGNWKTLTSNNPPSAIYPLPNPTLDGIFLSRQSQIEVIFYNCMKIGLSIEEMMTPTCQSPWYSPLLMPPSSTIALQRVPPDLYPTLAQLRYPHHPFIDTVPLPWFRERAITLASMDPPAYNRSELKRDILIGGMVVWRSRGKEEGLPWDRRNWEVLPWFWQKWGWLVEEQGRVEQQASWWRSMRGK